MNLFATQSIWVLSRKIFDMTFLNEDRIKNFEENSLGLARDNVVRLEPHNNRWKRIFADEAYLIFQTLNIESLRLYHCGSTAIPGIVAKPILDIVGSINDLNTLDQRKDLLESIGYEYKGEYGIKGRRYSVLYNPDKTIGYCHLHIFKEDSKELREHIGFRDYLRKNNEAAFEYESVKKSLSVPRNEYSEAKTRIIHKLINSSTPYYHPRKKAKIVAVLGAAQGHKNTNEYLRSLYANNDIETIDLCNLTIKPYQYGCSDYNDDFLSIIEKFIEADRIILATPVYWYAMSGIMKDFVDRFSNLLNEPSKYLGEQLYGKKIDLLATGSDKNLPNGFTVPFNLTAIYFGMDFFYSNYKSL